MSLLFGPSSRWYTQQSPLPVPLPEVQISVGCSGLLTQLRSHCELVSQQWGLAKKWVFLHWKVPYICNEIEMIL